MYTKAKLFYIFSIKYKQQRTEFYQSLYNYFCICRGIDYIYQNIPQKYKYYFYLNIIDNNKNLFNKTDYLFCDFIFKQYSSDDTFPVFQEMINQNLPAHYLTENIEIYKNIVIPINIAYQFFS